MGHRFNISTFISISLQRGPQPHVDGVSSTVSSPLSICLHEGRCQFWLTLLGCRLDAFWSTCALILETALFPNREPDILASLVRWMVIPSKDYVPAPIPGIWEYLRWPKWWWSEGFWQEGLILDDLGEPNPITNTPERVRPGGLDTLRGGGHGTRAAPPAGQHLGTPGAGKARNRFSSEASGGSLTLALTSGVQNPKRLCHCLLLRTTQFAGICYGGPRKLHAVS